jgi:aldose 1-epimerase
MQVTLDFHPWFASEIGKGDSAKLLFAANQMFKRDDYLPTGETIRQVIYHGMKYL